MTTTLKVSRRPSPNSRGDGVFETLKVISKLTLRTLRRRMTGEDPVKATPRRPMADVASFRIREDANSPARTIAGTTPAPTSKVPTNPIPAYGAVAEPQAAPPLEVVEQVDEISAEDEIFVEVPGTEEATMPAALSPEPSAPEIPAPSHEPEPPPPAPAPEPDIDFGQTEKPTKGAPEVKHVKVRSSVDIMAELESLRKRATQSTPKVAAKKEISPLDILRHPPKPKRDAHRTLRLPTLPGTLAKSKQLRITVSFENDEGVVQSQEESIDLGETGDVQSLSVNLKFDDL